MDTFISLLYQIKRETISILYEIFSGSHDSSPSLKSYNYRKSPICKIHTVQDLTELLLRLDRDTTWVLFIRTNFPFTM